MPGFIAAVDSSVTVSESATELYSMSYIYGLFSSGLVYVLLHRLSPARSLDAFVKDAPSARELQQMQQSKWDVTLAETPEILQVLSGHGGKRVNSAAPFKEDA